MVISWGTGKPDGADTVSGDYVNIISCIYLQVNISGDPVVISGQSVTISGQHVFVESGVNVIVESGVYIASGQHVVSYVASGLSQIMVADEDGHIAGISIRHLALVTMDTMHREAHLGEMRVANCCKSGLGDGANLDMLVVVGSGLEAHTTFNAQAGGDACLHLFENVTVSSNGLEVTVHDMNRITSGQPETKVYCGPVVTSTYTELYQGLLPGGAGNKTAGGQLVEGTEWGLNGISGSINYLLRLVNIAGAAKPANLGLAFSEEDPVVVSGIVR